MATQDRPDLPEGQWLELIQRYQDMQPHEHSRDRPWAGEARSAEP